MDRYEMHIDIMDLYAANRTAARQAREDGMPRTGDRHDKIALHVRNAKDWMEANCSATHRIEAKVVFELVPNVNPVYNGSRGDLYKRDVVEARREMHDLGEHPEREVDDDRMPQSLEGRL